MRRFSNIICWSLSFAGAFISPTTGQDLHCLQLIQSIPTLSNFSSALTLSSMDGVLGDTKRRFTVFAPSNDAVAGDPIFHTYMSKYGWEKHLQSNIQTMIVPNQALLDSQIFDGATTELRSLNGTLAISQPFASVNVVTIQTPNNQAINCVVQIMNGVIKPEWRHHTLRDVDQYHELQLGLSPILDRIGFDEPLNEFSSSGVSFIASRNRGYGNDSIAKGFYPIVQELTNPDNAAFQNMTMYYNMLEENIYEETIRPGFQQMIMPKSGIAHIWVTKSFTDKLGINKNERGGILRFNDAELDRQVLADNGVTQIVTRPLVPPGIAMIMNYCAQYTTINLKDMSQFYESSGWNQRNLTYSIGTAQGSFNVFAPMQSGFGEFNIDVRDRISTLKWQRHLWDFLLHMTVEPAYTTEELYDIVNAAGGSLQMKMLSGFNTSWEIDQDGELTIDGARLLKPYDMKGIDGYVHLVEQVPLPPSVKYTIYEQTQQNMDMTSVTTLIDTVKMGVFIDNLLPLTFFSAVNSAWDVEIPALEIEDVIKNHLFEGLWFDDYLAKMDGEKIMSTNSKWWTIQVIEDPSLPPFLYAPDMTPARIYFINDEGPEGLTNCTFLPGPNSTNVLARTGVIHHVDCLFLDYNYTKSDDNAPTWAPIARTASPAAAPLTYAAITSQPVFATPAPVFTTAPHQAPSSASEIPIFPTILAGVITMFGALIL